MIRLPKFLSPQPGKRPARFDDLWAVAERLVEIGAGDITGYDVENRMLLFSSSNPRRLERHGGRPLTTEQLEELQDHVASLIY